MTKIYVVSDMTKAKKNKKVYQWITKYYFSSLEKAIEFKYLLLEHSDAKINTVIAPYTLTETDFLEWSEDLNLHTYYTKIDSDDQEVMCILSCQVIVLDAKIDIMQKCIQEKKEWNDKALLS